jgi:hypothetical protein
MAFISNSDLADSIRIECRSLAKEAMLEVFGRDAYDWQLDINTRLSQMMIPNSGVDPAPVLLVRPTGGGKSSVRDLHTHMFGGISLTISPLLSLGADQESKINTNITISQDNGCIVGIHLDEIHDHAKQASICNDASFGSYHHHSEDYFAVLVPAGSNKHKQRLENHSREINL